MFLVNNKYDYKKENCGIPRVFYQLDCSMCREIFGLCQYAILAFTFCISIIEIGQFTKILKSKLCSQVFQQCYNCIL